MRVANRIVLFSEVGDALGDPVGDPRSSGSGGSGETRPARASGKVDDVSPSRPISPSMRSSLSSSVDDDLPSRYFSAAIANLSVHSFSFYFISLSYTYSLPASRVIKRLP